ncbi:copper ion binding protein [Lipingzhangella halophila]|uniref:Copper ion binding protein n=1 Tax=Lipingzhangella halophila TaxID=1783352 RepID=A0A7W7REW2_9ACTN|nr:copper ion binding protein [Lipingzhangella halophila]MBB4930724.1 copper ion binding protein [Lipingzhangella halophila]
MASTTITVAGMSCGHCVNSVKEEVGALPGVQSIEVDLESGRVTVDSSAPLPDEQLRAAIDEAGYDLLA